MRASVLAVLLAAGIGGSAHSATLVNGVAAGDVSQTGVTLWGHADVSGAFGFEVSTTSDFTSVVFSSSVAAGTVPVHQAITGLTAGTRYFYRGTDTAGNQSVGTFVTASATGHRGLRFGVSGDSRGDLAPFPGIANVAQRNLDFFGYIGDSIYADVASPALPVAQAKTLDEYRIKQAEQLTPRQGLNSWVHLRQSTALFSTIDDHEVTNDFAGGATIGSDPRFAGTGAPTDLINTSTLFRNGVQAFQDYMPIESRTWAGTGDARTDGRPDLYRVQNFGKDATYFMVDARSFRDAGIDDSDPAQTLGLAFTPGRTLLGNPQLTRLETDLLAAQADGVTWKFVALPEPIQNFGPLGSSDRYEGYAAERSALLAFISDHNIRNVVFVSADIHGTSINNLTYQALNPANPALSFLGPQIATSAIEVTTGPVSQSQPFGPTLANLGLLAGLLTPQQFAFYKSLPIAPDTDGIVNDKDDFIKALINGQLGTVPPGHPYSALGLADSGLSYKLVAGDWLMGHQFGWTEFDVDAETQQLRIINWGIAYDQVLASLNDPEALARLTPRILGDLRINAVVPEPAGWATMLLGFGLLGASLRTRRSGGLTIGANSL